MESGNSGDETNRDMPKTSKYHRESDLKSRPSENDEDEGLILFKPSIDGGKVAIIIGGKGGKRYPKVAGPWRGRQLSRDTKYRNEEVSRSERDVDRVKEENEESKMECDQKPTRTPELLKITKVDPTPKLDLGGVTGHAKPPLEPPKIGKVRDSISTKNIESTRY